MTDQIGEGVSEAEARKTAARLQSGYHRAYYTGIICERSAKAILKAAYPGCQHKASVLLQEAMACFERAEDMRPSGNDDAILRWNTCARMILRNPELEPKPAEKLQEVLGE
jgi:hypothetical protein